MKIKLLQNKLFIKNKFIYQTPGDINGFGLIPIGIIIIWNSSEIKSNSNLVLLDQDYELKWTIQSKKYPRDFCPIIDFEYSESKIVVYRQCGIEETIDINTGKILKSELVK
ncbi:hypothetical protein [Christiangramia sp. SM2212]|uniref:Uncharacterized protein n=1 Tax=Christiangramia sediminicola TaxID=3073267 RepID=A0ABU1ETF7_9FLAO|nr:hypothetical protein [Christiangramia sp. SM2212]MDR5591667.1 hypothetical protein [Christiangramia sp. SM2212]